MKRIAIFLKLEQWAVLSELSQKSGAPIAELIRRAVETVYLKKQK